MICQHCGRRHFGTCRILTGGCFRCEDQRHRLNNCPLVVDQAQSEVSVQQSNRASSGSGFRGNRSNSYMGVWASKEEEVREQIHDHLVVDPSPLVINNREDKLRAGYMP